MQSGASERAQNSPAPGQSELRETLAVWHRGDVRLRNVPSSPDGDVIADFTGELDDPEELARRFEATVGVVEHGSFPVAMVTDVVVARGESVEVRALGAPPSASASSEPRA